MPSQTDLDQGGTNRLWERVYMGASVGWKNIPSKNFIGTSTSTNTITAADTYVLDWSTNFVQVNVAGAVTIVLPAVSIPSNAMTQPGRNQRINVTIVDIGNNGQAHPITIQPAAGDTVMGLAQIQITTNYGGFVLEPVPAARTWVNAQ